MPPPDGWLNAPLGTLARDKPTRFSHIENTMHKWRHDLSAAQRHVSRNPAGGWVGWNAAHPNANDEWHAANSGAIKASRVAWLAKNPSYDVDRKVAYRASDHGKEVADAYARKMDAQTEARSEQFLIDNPWIKILRVEKYLLADAKRDVLELVTCTNPSMATPGSPAASFGAGTLKALGMTLEGARLSLWRSFPVRYVLVICGGVFQNKR